jgi:unsaturated rhamnogalacturonyl hydrolase
MSTYKDSMVVKKFANHLLQDNQVKPGQTVAEAQANRSASWSYEIGVVLMGFERLAKATNDRQYADYIKHILDKFITDDGGIRTYEMTEYNSDYIPPGRPLFFLQDTYHDSKYEKATSLLRQQIAWQPRNKTGGFWHKLKYPTQMWLDGLYMIEPFYAEYALRHQQLSDFNDIINQFVWMEQHARDPKSGLLYHGWDESHLQKWANPTTGQSPEFWSRAMGWYMMALADVLEIMPMKQARRGELVAIYNRLAKAIVRYQDPASGVWWQVTNKANQPGNYLESSATAMFVFGLAKGMRLGCLDRSFASATNKAWNGMIKEFVQNDSSGIYHYLHAVAGAGLGGTPYRDGSYEYYISEPKRDDDLKAIGPFMQACVEMEFLFNNLKGR